MEERRGAPRAPFTGWVEITTLGHRRVASGRDLSASGIGVALRFPVPSAQTPVMSEFALPGISLPLALDGVVVWSDPGTGSLGVRFDGINPGLVELLDSYVSGRF